MEARRIVVVEANEVPLRIVEDLADSGRIPFLAGLLDRGDLIETIIEEDESRELYPSQTWASMNTGVPFAEHRVYWYGDAKPDAYPLYWQLAARSGRSVGLVNTLHSSPLDRQCRAGDFRFAVPDCFSTDDHTIPTALGRFQRANRALTASNSRRAGLRPDPGSVGAAVDLALAAPRLGLRPGTLVELATLVAGVAAGRIPSERLRFGQFLLQRDLFLRLLRTEQPDLAVLFTNHVAAAMHRYWYARYPADFAEEHYGPAWVERYHDEVPKALELLDRFLSDAHRWCVHNDRTLVLVSSMGQGPSPQLSAEVDAEAVIVDVDRFLAAIGVDREVRVRGAMVPQLTLDCGDESRAAATAARLADAEVGEVFWDVAGSEPVVTLTYHIDVLDNDLVLLGGVRRPARSIGVAVYPVDDHSSGRHTPHGVLGIANSPTFKPPEDGVVDCLDFAPALLQHLGLPPAAHHQMPRFGL